ncbi:MAG: nucleotidyltransferase family protein [Anaerolineae bacterium]
MIPLSIARFIARSLHLDAAPPPLTEDVDWAQLVHHADGHSLTPLLFTTWREAGFIDQLPLSIQDHLTKAYHDNARRNQYIRRELLEIHQLLTGAGVPHLVLKGWPLAERLYADPAQRVLYDHDFLVPPERAEAGWRALNAAGFRPLPGKDGWIEKHLPPVWRNDGYDWNGYLFDPHYPRPVELHLRLWEQGWRGLNVTQLPDPWPAAQTRPVAGTPMRVLSDEDALVHLAMHFAGHLIEREARLSQLLDLARFVQQASGLDWGRVLAQAGQANVGRFVYASLFLAHRLFGAPLPPAGVWSRLARATPPAFRAWLARHGVDDALTADYRRPEKGQDYRLTFLAARSTAERLGIVRFAALPPAGQLMAKYHLRHRWLSPLFYPRHLIERVGSYGRAVLGGSD